MTATAHILDQLQALQVDVAVRKMAIATDLRAAGYSEEQAWAEAEAFGESVMLEAMEVAPELLPIHDMMDQLRRILEEYIG